MEQTLAELNDIVVHHGPVTALGPLSMVVARGQFWGVVGPNGAGKTTLLRVLSGLQGFSEGHATLLGRGILPGRNDVPRALRRRVGLLFQHHDFASDLPFSAKDIVLFGRVGCPGLGRRYRRVDFMAAEKAISTLGLMDFQDRLYRDLSGGERQKVQLARLLAQEAELLLLDEPSAGLDLDWQERLTQLIGQLHVREEKTIVMVTHNVDRLPACCTDVLLLQKGNVLGSGPPRDTFGADSLSKLYGCRVEVAERGGRWYAASVGVDGSP